MKNKQDLVAPFAPPKAEELTVDRTYIRSIWHATLIGVGFLPAYKGLAIVRTLQNKFLADTCSEILLEARGNPQAEELILKFYNACIKE